MRSMQQQLGVLGTISAFAFKHRETKKNLCRGGRSQDLPDTDFQPAIRQPQYVRQQFINRTNLTGRTNQSINQSPNRAYKIFSCCLLLTSLRLKHFSQYPIQRPSAYVHLYVVDQILHPQTHSVPAPSIYVQKNYSYNQGRHLAGCPATICSWLFGWWHQL